MFSGNADDIRPSPLFFFGTFLAGLGGYIRYSCYRALGRFFTFEMSIHKGHQLITNGPYRVVRHPAYTGIIFWVTGLICWHGSPVRIVDMWFFSAYLILTTGFMGPRMWGFRDQVRSDCCFYVYFFDICIDVCLVDAYVQGRCST